MMLVGTYAFYHPSRAATVASRRLDSCRLTPPAELPPVAYTARGALRQLQNCCQ